MPSNCGTLEVFSAGNTRNQGTGMAGGQGERGRVLVGQVNSRGHACLSCTSLVTPQYNVIQCSLVRHMHSSAYP